MYYFFLHVKLTPLSILCLLSRENSVEISVKAKHKASFLDRCHLSDCISL